MNLPPRLKVIEELQPPVSVQLFTAVLPIRPGLHLPVVEKLLMEQLSEPSVVNEG